MDPPDAERDEPPGPATWLTVPGRLLLIVTLIGSAALFYFYFLGTFPDLPPGSYPVLLWLVPVALAAVVFFVVAAFLLERLGLRIYRKTPDEP